MICGNCGEVKPGERHSDPCPFAAMSPPEPSPEVSALKDQVRNLQTYLEDAAHEVEALKKEATKKDLQNGELRTAVEIGAKNMRLWIQEGCGCDDMHLCGIRRLKAELETVERALIEKRKDEVTLIEAPRLVCWFAEVNQESKDACSACKGLSWPKPGWIHKDGSYLTANPHEAKRFNTRLQSLDFCTMTYVRHWHLYPTEHMFVS